MTYEIIWKPKAIKALRKLPHHIALRIVHKVDALRSNPFRYLQHYVGADVYKLRVGSYRLLIDVDAQKKVVSIEVLDKRGRIYK